MMKIAFIGNKIEPTTVPGTQKYVEEVSLCMSQKGHEVFIYTSDQNFADRFGGNENIKVILTPKLLRKFSLLIQVIWASFDCIKNSYDVVHYQAKKTFYASLVVKYLCKETKIVSSFDLVCDFKNKPNVGLDKFDEKSSLTKWNLRDKRYMLLAGDFKKSSGAHFLIEAFKQLENTASTPNNFKLVILQTGEKDDDYLNYLKTISGGRDNIIILEKQTERICWLLINGAQLFVDASFSGHNHEILTRAMICGVTPLVSDTRENIEAVGKEGFIFEKKSVINLRDKLAYLLSRGEEVQKVGQKAKEKMEREFGWEKIAQKTIEICKNC